MAPTAWFSHLLPFLASLATNNLHIGDQIPFISSSLQNEVVPLPPSHVAVFKPYTWYAATTACDIEAIKNWNCGKHCEENPTFRPIATGGDGGETPFWFSGYDPTLDEVIVSRQGTDFHNATSLLQNMLVSQVPLDPALFPDIKGQLVPPRVHEGYAGVQSRTAAGVLAAVDKAFSLYPTRKVTVVGHGLGAAVALLDAMYLPQALSGKYPGVNVRYVGYASPRVGDQVFADYVDAKGMYVTRINNKQDLVPVLPTREVFEYHHVSNEIHIRDDNAWMWCPGQDNPSEQCSTGAVTLSTSDFYQHVGPYDGVYMGYCRGA